MQRELGVNPDGKIGPATRMAMARKPDIAAKYSSSLGGAKQYPGKPAATPTTPAPTPTTPAPTPTTPAPTPAAAAAPKGPNGEPLIKNASGVTGYMKQQGRGQVFVPYTPPVKENAELAELIRLTHSLK
jgi:hypothetical protein